MKAGAEDWRLALSAWSKVDLSPERLASLDQQGLEIADNQERSVRGREQLKVAIRDFKAVAPEERPAKISGVIKAFQTEVDALTLRQSAAEDSFLGLYRALADVPHPLAALQAQAAELEELGGVAAENASLRTRLRDYDREFADLKSQEHTIRLLQQQLRDADAHAKASADEALSAAQHRAEACAEEAAAVAAAELAAADARVARAHDEARAAHRALEVAQGQIFEMRGAYEKSQAAAAVEAEQLREEVERKAAQLEVATRDAAAQRASRPADGEGEAAAAGADAARRVGALEELLRSREMQLTKLTAEIGAAERKLGAQTAAADAERAALQGQLGAARAELNEAKASASAAEQRAAEREQQQRQQQPGGAARGGAQGGDGDGDGGPLRAMLVAQEARLREELLGARHKLAEAEAEAASAREAEAATRVTADERARAIAALEEALESRHAGAAAGAGSHTSKEPVLSTLLSAHDDGAKEGGGGAPAAGGGASDSLMAVVTAQRNRYKTELEGAQSQLSALTGQLRAAEALLVERHGAAGADIEAGGGSYRRKERAKARAELSSAERLLLSFATFFLANRHARNFLFGYIVSLHGLVSLVVLLHLHNWDNA